MYVLGNNHLSGQPAFSQSPRIIPLLAVCDIRSVAFINNDYTLIIGGRTQKISTKARLMTGKQKSVAACNKHEASLRGVIVRIMMIFAIT